MEWNFKIIPEPLAILHTEGQITDDVVTVFNRNRLAINEALVWWPWKPLIRPKAT